MKRIVVLLLGLLMSVSTVAEEFPKRKSGLWEIQTSMMGQAPGQTMKQCVDAASDAKMMQMGQDTNAKMGASCAKNDFRKEGGNFISESDCTIGGMRIVSRTVFSGDFNSEYSGETTASFDPALVGMTEQKMTITARWVGACEADQKPGDIIMPGGVKINIDSIGTFGNQN